MNQFFPVRNLFDPGGYFMLTLPNFRYHVRYLAAERLNPDQKTAVRADAGLPEDP